MKTRIYRPAAAVVPIFLPPAEALPPALALAIGRIHKRALGTAFGTVLGALIFLVTVVTLLVPGTRSYPLSLLSNFFSGYEVSWQGAVVGLFWGGFAGFVFGWFAAFCRNLVLAVWLFLARARAQMSAANDFLDHI